MNPEINEILLILQEECAEVTQAISKCMRFGIDQVKPGKEYTNLAHLEQEIGDIMAMVELLTDKDIGVTVQGIHAAKHRKFDKLRQWSNITIDKD